MPDYPPEALAAAVRALRANPWPDGETTEEQAARLVLDAAAPVLAEAVAAKILEHMEAHIADPSKVRLTRVGEVGNRAARRHFRTAAQIASLAFSTREDQLRMAGEAIEQGRFIACDIPEVPGAPA